MAPRGRRTELSGAICTAWLSGCWKWEARDGVSAPRPPAPARPPPECPGQMERMVDTVGAVGQVRAWRAGVPVRRRHSGAPIRGFLGGRFETPEGSPAQGQAFSVP